MKFASDDRQTRSPYDTINFYHVYNICGPVEFGLWWFVVVCGGLWYLVQPDHRQKFDYEN